MKYLLTLLLSVSIFAAIPAGDYKLDRIVCSSGKELKLGGKFMVYTVTLDVTASDMRMTAIAKSGSWAPFRLDCTQTNYGKYSLVNASTYQGYLGLENVTCNNDRWTDRLRKRPFAAEPNVVDFNYSVSGNSLVIKSPNTTNNFKSCAKDNAYPIYYYTKQ